MATYYETARTNHIKLKAGADAAAFAERWDIEMEEDDDGRVVFFTVDADGWPMSPQGYDEDADIDQELTDLAEVDEIIIYVETGHENARYVTGYAVAMRNGEKITLDLRQIQAMAEEKWGVAPSKATY